MTKRAAERLGGMAECVKTDDGPTLRVLSGCYGVYATLK